MQRPVHCMLAVVIILAASTSPGCVTWDVNSIRRLASVASWGPGTGVEIRKQRRNPLRESLNFVGKGGPKPSDRTTQFLRRYDLLQHFQNEPDDLLLALKQQTDMRPSLERLYVLAELAFIEGERARGLGDAERAGRLLITSAVTAHKYLFDKTLDPYRNAYDPEFRQTCDLYNASLEGVLRIMRDQETLTPGATQTLTSLNGDPLQLTVAAPSRWQDEQFEKFEFASDYKTEGLKNVYHTYGLGVPLIGVRASRESGESEKYYPPGLTLPLTAFLSVVPLLHIDSTQPAAVQHCVLQLLDPLQTTEVSVDGRIAPLESDITTPLAYYLDDPLLNTNWFATAALLNADFARQFHGLYMLEPYDPQKIPVVMVHGLWSSPVTWTTMFNDLRAEKTIRDNYQFWFYLYPTGQPFWISARKMRDDLAQARTILDRDRASTSLDEMVLVGHSMGGLVSRLQTIDSGDQFWQLVSDQPMASLQGEEDSIRKLRETLYFEANRSIGRVITLGTPHHGSNFANSLTRWIGHKFFRLPSNLTRQYRGLVKANPETFTSPDLLTIDTSIDSLSPDSPFFEAMSVAKRSPFVQYHNIIGDRPPNSLLKWVGLDGEPSDGVVEVQSAKIQDAVSELTVQAEHTEVHQHPQSVLEVRRILLQHLIEAGRAGGEILPVRHEEALQTKVPYASQAVLLSDEPTPPSRPR